MADSSTGDSAELQEQVARPERRMRDELSREEALEEVLRIGRAVEAGDDSFETIYELTWIKAPEGDAAVEIGRLRELDGKVLRVLMKHHSQWLPLILEALPERKVAEVLKVVIGTFYDTLLPPEIDGWKNAVRYPMLHPGRAVCGFTNMGPFFNLLEKTPLPVLKRALVDLRRLDPYNEYGARYVTHFLGLPPGRERKNCPARVPVLELSRRVPAGGSERETMLQARARAMAEDYFETRARKTGGSESAPFYLRSMMYPHAEAAGFASIEEALLDMVARWAHGSELGKDGLILRKCPDEPEGLLLIKGKRTIQSIPPTLKKDREVAVFRAEAFALWQARLYFEMESMARYLETGEMMESAGFEQIFGRPVTATLHQRLETRVPEAFERELRTALEVATLDAPVPLGTVPVFKPSAVVPGLIQRGGWDHALGRGIYHGFFHELGDGDARTGFLFKTVPLEMPDREHLTPPSTPHTLALSRMTPGSSAARAERLLGVVMRDLVEAIPGIG